MLSTRDYHTFHSVASKLRIKNPEWLVDLVNFESGFNPKATNLAGSGAKGLIQFMPPTARGLGYADSQDLINKHPTIKSQLEGPVYRYLKPYAPFNTEAELYLAVFLPVARKYPTSTPFSKIYNDHYGSSGPSRYKVFERQNPGIKTPQDYINFVKKKKVVRIVVKGGIGLIGVFMIYLAYRMLR